MKRLLLLSLLGNGVLAALLALVILRPRPVATSLAQAPAQPRVITNSVPFHWRQVESSSYPVYIANLRSIGCPEATINDIISADLKALFDARRTNALAATNGPEERRRLVSSVDREEQAVKRQLLTSLPPPVPKASTASSVPAGASTGPAASEPAANETLLSTVADAESIAQLKQRYAAINPTEIELRLLQDLSKSFAADFGSGTSSASQAGASTASDPGSEHRRREALQNMDDLLRSLIGYPRYNDYLREAMAKAQLAPQAQ
ncbi:MAG: hypothetical protein EBS05_18760 [Proteobacteria bacterium]|nr:hypothetical protein [Pseudomonadota bacterium]